MYGRKLARVLRAKRAASSWGILDWEVNECHCAFGFMRRWRSRAYDPFVASFAIE